LKRGEGARRVRGWWKWERGWSKGGEARGRAEKKKGPL
jgi:hypothetical protein